MKMSHDIVDELRDEAIFDPVRQKAADEIMRLRKLLGRLLDELPPDMPPNRGFYTEQSACEAGPLSKGADFKSWWDRGLK